MGDASCYGIVSQASTTLRVTNVYWQFGSCTSKALTFRSLRYDFLISCQIICSDLWLSKDPGTDLPANGHPRRGRKRAERPPQTQLGCSKCRYTACGRCRKLHAEWLRTSQPVNWFERGHVMNFNQGHNFDPWKFRGHGTVGAIQLLCEPSSWLLSKHGQG